MRYLASCVVLALALAGCQSTPSFDPGVTYQAADGRQFRVERLDKTPGSYARLGSNTLRYFPHATYELEREDDRYFYVRQYVATVVRPAQGDSEGTAKDVQLPERAHYRWQDFDRGLPRSGQWRDSFALADVNGDGHVDLVFGSARKSFSGPAIFLGDGKGSWTRWAAARFPALPYDYGGAAAADFDGDGKQDVAFAIHLRGVVALRQTLSTGVFDALGVGLPLARGNEPSVMSSRRVLAFDWRGNSRAALVAVNERLATDVASRIVDGIVVYELVEGGWQRVADDVRLQRGSQVATTSSGSHLVVSESIPTGGELRLSIRADGRWTDHRVSGLPDSAVVTAIAASNDPVADQGRLQIALSWRSRASGSWWMTTALARQDVSGRWQLAPLSSVAESADVQAMTFAALAGTGRSNIVTVNSEGKIRLFREASNGTWTREPDIAAPTWRFGCQGFDLKAKDLDGDGRDELVVAFAGESTALARALECTNGGGIQAFKLIEQ